MRVHANVLKAGFRGRLYAVNPKYPEVLGTGRSAGGVLTELVRDTQVRPAPVDEATAVATLLATRAGRLLQGFRGQPPRDLHSAARALVRLLQLIRELEHAVEDIDVNPLIVHEHGATVVDALVRGTYA
jgi:acetate---CoA ligase (ADP-forming)